MPLKFNSEISRCFSEMDGLEESWCRINLAQGGCSSPAWHLWLNPGQEAPIDSSRKEHANIKYNP